MRTVVGQTLDGTAVIQRPTNTTDSQGGYTQTFAAAGTVSCHLSPIAADERVVGDRIATDTDKQLTVAGTVDLRQTDRVVTGGTTYEVESVSTPRTWALALRAKLTELD